MVCSPAQLAANRENAKRSTGPSVASRSRTRFNALKHGMTASGMALPSEDQAEIQRLFDAISRRFNPTDELDDLIVGRVAFLACRLDRCQRYEIAMQSHRERHAEAAYTEERIALVDAYASKLNQDPTTCVRNLQAMPEGLQFLGYHLDELRKKLGDETRDDWCMGDSSTLNDLLGQPTGPSRFNRVMTLSESVRGFFANVPAGEWPGLGEAEKIKAARAELLGIIEAEIARLNDLYKSLDHDAFAKDRAESVDRALFDPSKEAVLARKYEAATERGLFRALRELEKINDVVDELVPDDEPEVPAAPEVPVEPTSRHRGSLASFFQKPSAPVSIDEPRPILASEAGTITPEARPNVVSEPFSTDRE